MRRQKHIREAYRKCVSLWSRKLQLAHPIFHQFFIFHSIVPVTVYNLLKFPTFASQSKPQHVGRPNPTNQWIRGKKQHLLFSAQWDSSDKKKQPMTQGRTRTVQRRVKKGVRRTSWQCFSVSDWSFLEGVWSLKQGVSTIESTSSRDKTISDCHCGKANQKEDPTLSIKFPSIAGFLEQYSKNTPGQSERLRSHCSPIVLKSKLSDIRFLRVFVPALQCNDKKKRNLLAVKQMLTVVERQLFYFDSTMISFAEMLCARFFSIGTLLSPSTVKYLHLPSIGLLLGF